MRRRCVDKGPSRQSTGGTGYVHRHLLVIPLARVGIGKPSVRAEPYPLARRQDQVAIRRLLPGTRIEERAIRSATARGVPPISHGESLRMTGDGDAAELETVRDGYL